MKTKIMLKGLSLLFGAISAAVVLTGCQSTGGHSPYHYRFADQKGMRVCLMTEPVSNETLAMQVAFALEEMGFKVENVNEYPSTQCGLCVRFSAQLGDWMGPRIQSATMEFTRESQGIRFSAKAQSYQTKNTNFGAPIDDDMILIRSLTQRLFPNPIPWQDE